MTDTPAYFEIWQTIVAAVREQGRDLGGNLFEVIEQPARTVAIRAWTEGQPTVQASITLNGDAIEIKRTSRDSSVRADEAPEIIEIEVKNGTVRFVHDDLESTADPGAVANMILAPILESRRKPQTEKDPALKGETARKK